jgi:transcriptional regulator with XRE-family HTH domain
MAKRRGPRVSADQHTIDVHVGGRLRLRRTLMGLSQERLGHALGLTFQQVQKYERGANRIGASRLYDLGRILDIPISFFFDDMNLPVPSVSADGRVAEPAGSGQESDPAMSRETLELVRAYYRIADAGTRKRLVDLIRALAIADNS